MLHRLKLAPRLAVLVCLGTGAILATVAYFDYREVQDVLREELERRARNVADATARAMEVVTSEVRKIVAQTAISLRSNPLPVDRIYRLLDATVREHKEIYGTAVALAGVAPVIPYVYREDGGIAHRDLGAGDYAFETLDWYALPRELGAPVWTEPYYDEGGGDTIMVTYAVPIVEEPGGRFQGVVTGDVALGWLRDLLASVDLGDGGYAFLLSRNGTLISHPDPSVVMRESIFSVAEKYGRPEARHVGQSMIRGERGFVQYTALRGGEPTWLAYTPVEGTGWSLAAVFRQRQITSKLVMLSRVQILTSAAGLLGMIAVVLAIAYSISKPIRALDEAAQALAGGDLDAPLPAARGRDEVAQLTRSFGNMQRDLRRRIAELAEVSAAKARIEGDLATARRIQLDLLPSRFVFDPPRPAVDIHAVVEPARAIGGDFYDFFFIDARRLFAAVGDVSGKGVPAALFMALSKAYLKAFVKHGHGPDEALTHINDELAIENDEGLFLTAFCASIDIETGACSYACGGHAPPFIVRAAGGIETVPAVKGPLIGLDGGRCFAAGEFRLAPGDLLFASSDGVSEAQNTEKALFGEERIARALDRLRGA
ncbi:MAG TPA: hypothetical protein DCM87_03625, partial [Planctomycetes bacterium]|nr:hypothetical protein [Planctomycetota bacterium]